MAQSRTETPVYSRDQGLTQRVEYDVDNNAIYVGRAEPGSGESELKWQIYKMTYVSGNMTALNWAQGNDNFNYSWTLRSSYTYS